MVVQTFEHMHARQFRAIPVAMQALQALRFVHLPSTSFLCMLDEVPSVLGAAGNVLISASDQDRFIRLTKLIPRLIIVSKALKSRKIDDLE